VSNLSSIEYSLSFDIGEVRGDRQDDVLGLDVGMLVELLELLQVVGKDLLWGEYLGLTAHLELEPNSLVLQWYDLLRNVPFFFLQLLNAVSVEAQESGEELRRVLEVLSDLTHGSITNQSLLICVSYYSTIWHG
jgi:hypothetical protein